MYVKGREIHFETWVEFQAFREWIDREGDRALTILIQKHDLSATVEYVVIVDECERLEVE